MLIFCDEKNLPFFTLFWEFWTTISQNQKIDFSFVSEHLATFWTKNSIWQLMKGITLNILDYFYPLKLFNFLGNKIHFTYLSSLYSCFLTSFLGSKKMWLEFFLNINWLSIRLRLFNQKKSYQNVWKKIGKFCFHWNFTFSYWHFEHFEIFRDFWEEGPAYRQVGETTNTPSVVATFATKII